MWPHLGFHEPSRGAPSNQRLAMHCRTAHRREGSNASGRFFQSCAQGGLVARKSHPPVRGFSRSPVTRATAHVVLPDAAHRSKLPEGCNACHHGSPRWVTLAVTAIEPFLVAAVVGDRRVRSVRSDRTSQTYRTVFLLVTTACSHRRCILELLL